MTGPGHVFVVHGSLTDLVCDLAVIPTARDMYVERYWRRYCPGEPGGPSSREVAGSKAALARGDRVGELVHGDGGRPALRYVDVGIGRGQRLEGTVREKAVAWLDDGVRRALAAVQADVWDGRVKGARERPLVAVPALGTGEGGFDSVRGEVTRGLLRRCEEAVVDGGFDVVVVCLHRSDFAYLQSQRHGAGREVLAGEEAVAAEQLGRQARDGRLSLFLGAGVSVAAGVPAYRELVRSASKRLGRHDDPQDAAEAAQMAQEIISALGEQAFNEAVEETLGQTGTALLHGLLASTRTAGIITTNFDDLFERSAAVSWGGTRLDVLPWERERRTPWLLKMHGSVGRSGRLVITADDLHSFNDSERPLASIVQAQLLLSDVLFVGYSLHDPNVQQLASGVRDLLRRLGHQEQTVGTILAIEPLGDAVAGLQDALQVVDFSGAGQVPRAEAARRLEVFCDVLLWHATSAEPAWQLDERYAVVGPDRDLRDRLRSLEVPDGFGWDCLREVLQDYGLGGRRLP